MCEPFVDIMMSTFRGVIDTVHSSSQRVCEDQGEYG